MKYHYNHWFKPEDYQRLVDGLTEQGHSKDAEQLAERYSASGGQLMRMDPKEAYSLSQKARVPMKSIRLPTDLKTIGKVSKAAKSSSLQSAFEVFASKNYPQLNLTKDNSGSYLYREAADRFEFFVVGTFAS